MAFLKKANMTFQYARRILSFQVEICFFTRQTLRKPKTEVLF